MLTIPNRPFATEKITGLMLPDGLFEITLGNQRINAHIRNDSGAPIADADVYVEGVSDPGIAVSASTQALGVLADGGARLVTWDLDLSAATPGAHLVSFVIRRPSQTTRIFKKIFVTKVTLDSSGRFTVHVPEGRLIVTFDDLASVDCCGSKSGPPTDQKGWIRAARQWATAGSAWKQHDPDFTLCPPPFLPIKASTEFIYTSPFDGQYGPLPFEDPWLKLLFCLLALLLLLIAAIVEATSGSGGSGGGVGVSTGPSSGSCTTCGVSASGGGTSYVAAGLVAAAAAAATIAAASDVRDPWRRGQDATLPAPGELTVSETLDLEFKPMDDIALGTPFQMGLDWRYVRHTDSGGAYAASASDVGQNVHTLNHYDIDAADVYTRYKNAPWIVTGTFEATDGHVFRGEQLLVQCFLCGPHGQYVVLPMHDDGQRHDKEAGDGTYTGIYTFREQKEQAVGIWTFFVIAQDVNSAKPDMTPEEAAQIIGGQVLTQQFTLTLNGGECPLVPDGHVNVI